MKLEERLGANKYYVDETCPHIIIDGESVSREEAMKLVNGCPAGLYTLQEDGKLAFDFAGCLECGTCRVLCGHSVVKTWKYPRNAKGVEFRQGCVHGIISLYKTSSGYIGNHARSGNK